MFIKRGHKAPTARMHARMYEPTAWDIAKILEETPHTTFLTISRRAAFQINVWAVEALFGNQPPLCYVDVAADGDEENEKPMQVPVYRNMRVTLTKNLNKKIGFVNGMGATVIDMCRSGILVVTDQGKRIMVHKWTNEWNIAAYPFRLGYANTLHKVQGATLKHITLWLDLPNMPAAAYVALSRVQKDLDWRFIGDPSRHHFSPARFD